MELIELIIEQILTAKVMRFVSKLEKKQIKPRRLLRCLMLLSTIIQSLKLKLRTSAVALVVAAVV